MALARAAPPALPRVSRSGSHRPLPCAPAPRPRRLLARAAPPAPRAAPPDAAPPAPAAPASPAPPAQPDAAAPPAAAPASGTQARGGAYDYEAAWWPVAFVADLDKSAPQRVMLLGKVGRLLGGGRGVGCGGGGAAGEWGRRAAEGLPQSPAAKKTPRATGPPAPTPPRPKPAAARAVVGPRERRRMAGLPRRLPPPPRAAVRGPRQRAGAPGVRLPRCAAAGGRRGVGLGLERGRRTGGRGWGARRGPRACCCSRSLPASPRRRLRARPLPRTARQGWEFSGGGACQRIPQGGDAASPRACATAFPAAARQGLLFVRPKPERGPGGAPADEGAIPIVAELEDPQWVAQVRRWGPGPARAGPEGRACAGAGTGAAGRRGTRPQQRARAPPLVRA
jgi:hypothetical protein